MSPTHSLLTGLRSGSRARIERIIADDGASDEFAALRLLPGEEIEVVLVIPLGGPVLVRTGGGIYALGRAVADRVWVTT